MQKTMEEFIAQKMQIVGFIHIIIRIIMMNG